MVVCSRVQIPIQKKQEAIITGSTASGRPASATKEPAQIKGVKSTRVIWNAKYSVCAQFFGTSSTPMETVTVLSGWVSKMGCSG